MCGLNRFFFFIVFFVVFFLSFWCSVVEQLEIDLLPEAFASGSLGSLE